VALFSKGVGAAETAVAIVAKVTRNVVFIWLEKKIESLKESKLVFQKSTICYGIVESSCIYTFSHLSIFFFLNFFHNQMLYGLCSDRDSSKKTLYNVRF
jgi:hypothetical protein